MHQQHRSPAQSSNLLQFRPSRSHSVLNLNGPREIRPAKPTLSARRPGPSAAAKQEHDARNALCSLHMLAGLLDEPGVLAPSAQHYARDLQEIAETLTHLIESFLLPVEVARRPQAASPAASAAPVSKSPTISTGETLVSSKPLLQTAAGPWTNVHVSSESKLPAMALPADAFHRVLINLVKNAGEAMGTPGGTVRVTARRALSRDKPAVLIHVSDNGPGIPAHALGLIFKPGFSSRSNRSCAPGLGLTVVRQLVESVGGSVRVGSTRRRGTTFELRIPTMQS